MVYCIMDSSMSGRDRLEVESCIDGRDDVRWCQYGVLRSGQWVSGWDDVRWRQYGVLSGGHR